jgi:signal transduction histidine kinase/CheY-like chemotaxis protein
VARDTRTTQLPGAPNAESQATRDQRELQQLRESLGRAEFLLAAEALLASAPDYEATLPELARLAVPRVADLCVVEIAGAEGTSTPVEVAHVDPAKLRLARERWGFATDGQASSSVFLPEASDAVLSASIPQPDRQELLSLLGVRSVMIVPICAGGRTIGAITLAAGESDRRYQAADLAMAERLAASTATAIDSARVQLAAGEAVRTREDLLGIVAHDLRNPLSGILMRCSLLLETLPQDQAGLPFRRDVEAIRRASYRMESLLRDLLAFAKIQAGGLPVERQPSALTDLLAEAIDLVAPLAGKRKVTVETQLAPEVQVRCDRERFLQIFANLIGNAIKFTKADGAIGIRTEQQGAEIRLSITDDGPGIAADEQLRLFQQYWQKHARSGGIGLGLYVTKTLVEAHGGVIGVQSVPGAGSTFFFTLPVLGAEPAPRGPGSSEILVVDDDAAFRHELVEVLAGEGYGVAEVPGGRQALNYLATHGAPSLILLDLMMPGMDGWELLANLRADQRTASIPVVAMSGLALTTDRAPLPGVSSYLRKPARREELLELATRHCAK